MRDSTQRTRTAANGLGGYTHRGHVSSIRRIASLSCFVILALMSYRVAAQAPTSQANNISILPVANSNSSVLVSWGSNGNGANRIVVVKVTTSSFVPSNGVSPNAGPVTPGDYAAATDVDPAGGGPNVAKVVFNSATSGHTGTSFTLTGISQDSPYFIQVYEYNGSGGTTAFNLLSGTQNPIGFQYNSSDGTFTRPTGVTKVQVFAWGGGGGGGGTDSNDTENRASGGGAGGSFTRGTDVTIGANIAITIGGGGAGGAGGNSPTNGTSGGTTTFASPSAITAVGGAGGLLGNSSDRTGNGAATTTGVTANGGAGAEAPPGGTTTDATASGGGGASGGPAGPGGAASGATAGVAAGPGAGNGAAGLTGLTSGTGSAGNNATQLGGGGSGSWDNLDNASHDGGNGFRGGMIVTWTTPPTPAITIFGPDPTNGAPVFRVVFSTPINPASFVGTDVTITGTTAGTEAAAIAEIAPNNGTTFTITVTGMTGSGTVIAAMAAGVVTDVSGNLSLVSNAGTTINYVHDVTGATPTITVSGPTPTNVNPVFQVVFNEPINISSFVGTDVTLTGTAGATTATILEIAPNDGTTFTITASGMSGTGTVIANMAVGVVNDRALTPNASLVSTPANVTISYDITPPAVPGDPTAAAGPYINAAENGTFTIVVPGLTGMVAGDVVLLYVDAVLHTTGAALAGGETSYNFTNVTLGAPDGPKSITARTRDPLGNLSAPNTTPLPLTRDIAAPSAPGNPTAAAGPVINIAENGTFTIVVPGFTGVAGDVVKLYLNAAPFLTGASLVGGETSYSFTNVTLPGPNGAKNIRATITDLAGNEGPQNAADLALSLDATAPPTPSAPTSAAAPTIDGAEYTAGFVVNVAGLGAATSGDVVELLLGGSPFGTPLTDPLDAADILAGNVNFTINCNQLGADGVGKLISARITEASGNTATSGNLSLDLSTEPTAASDSPITYTGVTTTQATLNFTSLAPGVGVSRIIVARQGAAVTFVPADNTTYTPNNDFAAALDQGGGNKVVGNATGNTITNLPSGDDIHFAVFEYNNCAGRENYFTTALTGNLTVAVGTETTVTTGGGAATISSIIDTQAEGLAAAANFSFVVDDDGANNPSDAAPTRVTSFIIRRDLINDQTTDWTAAIAGLHFSDGTTSINTVANAANFTLNPDDITITFPSALVTDLGYVADNTTKTYSLRLWLRTSITALDIDNKRFVFTVDAAEATTAATNSSGFAASNTTSGTGNGSVSVVATALNFKTLPPGGLQAGSDFTIVEAAVDVNGNVDLNQTQQVTLIAFTFPATGLLIATYATPANLVQNMTAGRVTWNGLKVTAGGNYSFRVSDTDPAAPLLTAATTGLINFTAPSNTSRIVHDPVFVEPATIDYTQYQHAALFTLASPPPAGAIEVGRFMIEDGFATIDADDIGTTLTAITFNVTNPGNLRFLGISPLGGNMIATVAATASSAMSGFSLLAEDTGNGGTGIRTFSVWASFDANVLDNQAFALTISSVTTGQGGSLFAAPNGGGASTIGGTNVVVVDVDRLNIVQDAPASLLIGNAMTPTITVEATDILGSRDLDVDFFGVGLTSNGSLVGAPSAVLVDGFGSYSSITHNQTASARQVTTANGFGWLNDTSTAFDLNASNESDIVENTGFYQINHDYASFQNPGVGNVTIANSVPAAAFDIRDGGTGGDLDGAPTNITALTLSVVNSGFISRAALFDGITKLSEVAPAAGSVAFSGFNVSVPDEGTRTLTVRVTFTTAVTDNQQFSFTVTNTTTQALVSSLFLGPAAGGAATSTAGDINKIEVFANHLAFTTNFISPLLPAKNINLQTPNPVVEALDIFNVRDRDYNSNVNIGCALLVTPNLLTPDNAAPNAGLYTFPNSFQYQQTGIGTITVSAAGLTNATSISPINVNAGVASTITAGAIAPATISSLIDDTPGTDIAVFNFVINDDPEPATLDPNDDGFPTLISQIVITQNLTNNTISDWSQVIASATLNDGVNPPRPATITATSLSFGGIPTGLNLFGYVADDASKTYTLRITLRTNMVPALQTTIDGLRFEFQVLEANINVASNSTDIIALESATTGARNMVDVAASTLRFTNPTGPQSVSLDTDIPGYQVEAIDANLNRDLDFEGASGQVTQLTNAGGVSMSGQPALGTQFLNGILNFGPTFRFTSGSSGTVVTLNIRAGSVGNTNCGVNAVCATSPVLTLLSSFESAIIADPTYVYSATIPYVAHQEGANIQNTATSFELTRMLLIDGSRSLFPYGPFLISTSPDTDGLLNADLDGAATNVSSLTLRVTNPSNLRRIALYSGGVEVPGTEIDVTSIVPIVPGLPFYDFVFAGAPLVSVNDNQIKDLSVRVSFHNVQGEVDDRDQIQVSVIAASTSSGSAFHANGPGGITGGFQSSSTMNVVNVVATKLDFVTQPAAFAGIAPAPVTAGTLEAHDQFGLLDTDYNEAATVTAPVPVSASVSFSSGTMSLASMLYGSVGDGTVTVFAGTGPILASNATGLVGGLPNVSVQCNHVDVVHVGTSGATTGVVTTTNLVGNTFNHVIFGVTFKSDYGVVAPSIAPRLNSFVITFSNPITNVFLNNGTDFPKVYESSNNAGYEAGTDTDITTAGGSIVTGTQTITVNLGGLGFDLSTPGSEVTYFLEVDIDPLASGSTPQVQPLLADGGFGSPTDGNITTNFGTATSNVAGKTYSFAAIFPPVLTSSYPATGQLNVDPAQGTIALTFGVPVWTLDSQILLYDQTTGGPPVVCTAANGIYSGGTGTAVTTLIFNIPPALPPRLIANHVYFVTIAAGNLTNLTGIMDEANNAYPGFNFPGTLYFKAANPVAPKLLGPNTLPTTAPNGPFMSNVTLNGATVNATFDQQGTAHYLILKSPAPIAPTNAQILAPGTYPSASSYVAGAGTFQIVQTNPISQYGLVQPIATGLPGPVPPANQFLPNQAYEVWIYAENNALPIAFSTTAPYGSAPLHTVGGSGPTLSFTTPSVNPAGAGIVSGPTVTVCNNSYQFINQPIVISESNTFLFNTGGTAVSLNIGLPAGFQFDVSRTGGVPTYGQLNLVGSDFVPGSGAIDFLGNSIVRIRYASNAGASLDKIIISNLRVLATASTTGNLFRIGGTALTGPIPDLTNMGTLTSFDAPIIFFDNTYSSDALGNPPNSVVTSIPDNADDLNPGTAPGTIALIPTNPNADDFGPNSFTGLGVNINILTLSAVLPDIPFNITIQHTDNNGCISNNAVQYTVYDNLTAVKMSRTVPTNPANPLNLIPPPATFVQSPFCADNTQFINTTNPVANPYIRPTLGVDMYYVAFNNLAGHYLRNFGPGSVGPAVTAKIPDNADPTQIIFGPDWQSVISTMPITLGTSVNIPGGNPPSTQNFQFDLAKILDAPNTFPATIPDPYSHFRVGPTPQGNYYYRGGSLGVIEFTGTFQSTTNATVIVPRRQQIEVFVPPVPLVEASIANRTYLDTNDNPLNLPGSGGINGPTNQGTNVYCQAGGVISITAYPAATPGTSTGRFTIVDAANPATIIYDVNASPAPITALGFIDNGNGTATLDPNIPIAGSIPGTYDPLGKIRNGYRDMKIIYTYSIDAAPTLCAKSAYQIIRITPNPIAGFDVASTITPYVKNDSARCVKQPIQFTSTAAVTGDATASVVDWRWDFGDVSSSSNIITFNQTWVPGMPTPVAGALANPLHSFDASSGTYVVKHLAKSNYGCLSGPAPISPAVPVENVEFQQSIAVGDIPTVKYKLDGVSKVDVFRFTSNDKDVPFPGVVDPLFSTAVSANDFIKQFVWDFGDSTSTTRNRTSPSLDTDPEFNADIVTHTYTSVGRKQINLTVTSNLGCVNSLALQGTYRSIVVLPREVLPAGSASVTDFEPLTGGHRGWQVWGTGTTVTEIQAGAAAATWEYGPPDGTGAIPAEPLISKTRVWKTNIKNFPSLPDSTYNPGENSALYSSSFDLQNLTRPMISFNAVVQMESSDGVVLEYSLDDKNIADPTKVWKALGTIGTGEDWYTDQGIAGRPGTQTSNDFGWSRIEKTNWQSPKHVLDDLFPPNSAVVPSKAVFRWALGSAAPSVDVQGFTLDNVRIGDRTRTILLESFASTSNTSTQEASENTFVQNFIGGVGTEVVKLNYHLNFPGKDPFNEDNPGDPSSRALFYNITSTPRSVLDGEKDPQDRVISQWGQALYNLRTLQLAQADIKITPTVNLDGSISIMAKVTSRVLTGLQPNTLVHVVALEKQIMFNDLPSTKQGLVKSNELMFEYVVKKMLPSAAGSQFGAVLPDTVSRFFGPFVWKPEASKLYPSPNDLVIAVFLQESTPPYEVYQVELVEPINDPPSVTGLEGLTAEQVLVYPNPANHDITVQMPGLLARPARLSLIDQTGREALTGSIPEGADRNTLSVRELSGGIYILTIDMGEGVLTRKKVMVVHQD